MASSFPYPPVYIAPVKRHHKNHKQSQLPSSSSTAPQHRQSISESSANPFGQEDETWSGQQEWGSDTETLSLKPEQPDTQKSKEGFKGQLYRIVASKKKPTRVGKSASS
ncbi:hypothetical protein TruAng_010264 [Truncatella angustata]|nr:hypothetical protein TruAng_010264 [Truncatella angustata]